MNRRTLAREWLYLLAGIIVGALRLIGWALFGSVSIEDAYARFLAALHRDIWPSTIPYVMTPYLLFQLFRSVWWAVRVLRSSTPGGGNGPEGAA